MVVVVVVGAGSHRRFDLNLLRQIAQLPHDLLPPPPPAFLVAGLYLVC